ncbi:MAG: adenylyltransferase [Deltaproteobacteria bacterium]|nr:MAG: adenylyltransferase [Deltaproteobacteria bacterium]
MLSRDELIRYSRQIMLPSFGEEGQQKLKAAHVVVAGVGGLGSLSSMLLVAAGVGHLTLIDADRVELSNLNRQILHWEEDIGVEKVLSAARKLRKLNSTVEVMPRAEEITEENVASLVEGADLVMDAMDNMATRFILNEACVKMGIPFIHGGIHGLLSQITTIIPRRGPCLRCIFPQEVEGKKPFPVLGATPAMVASLQVMEAIKVLVGMGELLVGRMLLINGEVMEIATIEVKRNPQCPVCGDEG